MRPMEPTQQAVDDSVLTGDEGLSYEVRMARWQAKRPPIDHLKSGIMVDPSSGATLPLFDVGDRIVVDCRTGLLKGSPWLETLVGKVRSIDDDSGLVTLFDEDSDPRCPTIRYASFKRPLFTFCLAPDRGDPFEPPPPPKKEKPQRLPGQKGRGRPKGSKNRPKDVIKAEREARKAARKEK